MLNRQHDFMSLGWLKYSLADLLPKPTITTNWSKPLNVHRLGH